MKKVIIVDDEAPARKLIKEFLQSHKDLIVIEECNNGVDAVIAINKFKPDLVFLDIQMPGLTGFEVLQRLDEMPQIIFSTAYDQYAIRAIKFAAVDYLLKPINALELKKSVDRVLNKQLQQDQKDQLKTLLHNLQQQEKKIKKRKKD